MFHSISRATGYDVADFGELDSSFFPSNLSRRFEKLFPADGSSFKNSNDDIIMSDSDGEDDMMSAASVMGSMTGMYGSSHLVSSFR